MRLALVLALVVPAAAAAQESPAAVPDSRAALERASPEARADWNALCTAATGTATEPLRAFQLTADVLTRSGVQTNQTHIDYRYLAPDCIRFVLPGRKETGRFGPAQEAYWLKDGDEVVVLAGREYKEDRKLVDDMLVLARNYVALTGPTRLGVLALERLESAPADLGPRLLRSGRKLRWLALESPDFALVRGELEAPGKRVYRVELGLGEDHLPAIAIVRERDQAATEPLLVKLSDYAPHDGYRVPGKLLVHVLDHRESPLVFAEEAAQEVYVTGALLRPSLTVEDFKPRPKGASRPAGH